MNNLKLTIREHSTQSAERGTAKSFHHRMARLIRDAYDVKCGSPGCPRVAEYICEWDQAQGKKTVARHKLYCTTHACSFATKHNIYMADLPDVRHSQLETAGRDDWRYGGSEDSGQRTADGNPSSVIRHPSSGTASVAQTNSEER